MRRVDPKVYTKEYYLTDATGHEEFEESYGSILEPRLTELIKCFNIPPKANVLDIGCGRGEMVLFCAKKGASAIGIDYSDDAIKLAKFAQAKQPKKIKDKMTFLKMDAKKLQFKDSFFDIIILTDVVEHLYPEELDIVFKEIKRVLKKDGLVVIHTAPNKWFNDIGYKYYSYPVATAFVNIWNSLLHRQYPNIATPEALRVDSHAIMHINEPTYFSLKKLFRKHTFEGRIISTNITAKKPSLSFKDIVFNFLVFFHPITTRYPFNIFLGSDFVSILKNKK